MWKRIGPRFWDIIPINEHGNIIPIEEVCMGVAQNNALPGETVHVVKWNDMKQLVYDVQRSTSDAEADNDRPKAVEYLDSQVPQGG